MSRVMRAIDAKSFIIGVLSAVIVVMAMGADDQTGDAFDFFNDGSQKPRRTDETPSAESPIYDDPFADDPSSVASVCDSWDYNQRWEIKAVDAASRGTGDPSVRDVFPEINVMGWEPFTAVPGDRKQIVYRRPICNKP